MAKFRTQPFTSPLCRISYAKGLHDGRENDGGNVRYSVTLIFPKDQVAILQKAVADCVAGEWGEKGVERFKKGLIKNPILAGDSKSAHDKDGNLKAGMGPDIVFIRPSSNDPVKCFDARVQPMDARDVKSGYWGKAALNCFAWHNPSNGDGVSFGINMWQHIKEDEILGGDGGADPTSMFAVETVDTSGETVGAGGAGDMFG